MFAVYAVPHLNRVIIQMLPRLVYSAPSVGPYNYAVVKVQSRSCVLSSAYRVTAGCVSSCITQGVRRWLTLSGWLVVIKAYRLPSLSTVAGLLSVRFRFFLLVARPLSCLFRPARLGRRVSCVRVCRLGVCLLRPCLADNVIIDPFDSNCNRRNAQNMRVLFVEVAHV